MPAVFMSHLIPSMEAVHALANKLTGRPADSRLPGLYVPITSPNDSLTFQYVSAELPLLSLTQRFTPWEKGGHIAALVSLIFMFFVMALFVCCCAFTQSALIIEDYNHRDEMQLLWRLQENDENDRLNGPHLQRDPDNLSMHSEATQASVEAESEHALL
ncbi:hypothetical protein GCK32_016456 [Trichostrongylus colubriformis]|uniref:Uncharacterized protein n=1 Tax=Trichostrongylus colubriformis TaxID=6319 RepID=A0AAN8G939_TRICO